MKQASPHGQRSPAQVLEKRKDGIKEDLRNGEGEELGKDQNFVEGIKEKPKVGITAWIDKKKGKLSS